MLYTKANKITIKDILYKEVINNIKNHQSLVLAFSGGLDSTVLLDILHNIKNDQDIKSQNNNMNQSVKLRAIHIHHGLSHNADYWADHCAKECEKRNIPFNYIRVDCNKNNGAGIESTARKIRYQYLFNNLQPKEILLTAQHLNDQSETFLLALKRGSGPKGLSSMPKKKLYININYYVHYCNVVKNK